MGHDRQHHLRFVLGLIVICSLVAVAHQQRVISFKNNLMAVSRCACNLPQPRLIHIDELEEYASPDATFIPSALLVHRCERSVGYCHQAGHGCASVEADEEELKFVVQKTSAADRSTVMIHLRNHTRCECVGFNSGMSRAK